MIYAGIDVAKDKHDCCILGSDGEKLIPIFTIPNNRSGFNEFFEKLFSVSKDVRENHDHRRSRWFALRL